MSHLEEKNQYVPIGQIVDLLLHIRTGNLPSDFTNDEGRKTLKPILDEVNALMAQFQAKTQRYQYILDGAGLGSWDWWIETNQVNFDRRWCEMLGLKFNETLQQLSTWDSRIHPDDKVNAYSKINAYLAGETSVYESIHRLMHTDGHWVWIMDRGRISESDSTGKPIRFTGTHFDITAFMEQQRLSEEIQKIAHIGGWELEPATGKTHWTPETYRIHGIDEGTATDKVMGINFYAPKDREKIAHYVAECLNGEQYQDVLEFNDAMGTKKWVEVMGKPQFDSTGKVYKISGTIRDVSDKVQREEEVRFILDTLGIGVWKFNPFSRDLLWDKSMYQLFDVSEKEFSSHYSAWENSLTPEARAKAVEELEMALRGEKDFHTTFEISTKSYGRRHIAGRGKVIRNDNGDPIMMYGVNFDRTDEEITERELELEKLKSIRNSKLASLGEMSAGIAHEINNPLAIILGTARALPKFVHLPEQLTAKIENIQAASERISKIVKSLRKFSRTSDKSEYKVHSLLKIVKESLILTEAKARRHATKISIDCKSDSRVFCEEIEIEQVLVNLIGNAIDAVKTLSERWVILQIHENNGLVVLQIRNSGPRINPEIEKKLFQPFFTTKPVGQGTGLGLSIAKGILNEHQATIELLADDPHTCFEICFLKDEVKKNDA